jgi:NhaP-type Na+/H+ or K+/H+ antiporter
VAEQFHASGVLAVVVAGLYLSRRASEIFNHQTRLQTYFVWEIVVFLLNGIIFILIGLQLHLIVRDMHNLPVSSLLWYGVLISLTTIVVRIVWVYPGTYLPRWFSKRIRQTEPRPNVRMVGVVAWSGMRGVVSLAAALALPLTVGENSIPFPNRDIIIFLTFCVIFATLVIQGLTLPKLIQWFGIKPSVKELEEEHEARLKVASAMIEHIEENYSLSLNEMSLNEVKTRYEIRIQRIRKDQSNQKISEAQINELQSLRQDLINTERQVLLRLRKAGDITDDVLRKIEYELDLEEEQLLLQRAAV